MIESQPPTSGFKERVRVERYVAAFGCCCGHSAASAVPSSNNKKKKSSRNEVTGHPATLMDIGASSLPSQYLTEVHGSELRFQAEAVKCGTESPRLDQSLDDAHAI